MPETLRFCIQLAVDVPLIARVVIIAIEHFNHDQYFFRI